MLPLRWVQNVNKGIGNISRMQPPPRRGITRSSASGTKDNRNFYFAGRNMSRRDPWIIIYRIHRGVYTFFFSCRLYSAMSTKKQRPEITPIALAGWPVSRFPAQFVARIHGTAYFSCTLTRAKRIRVYACIFGWNRNAKLNPRNAHTGRPAHIRTPPCCSGSACALWYHDII